MWNNKNKGIYLRIEVQFFVFIENKKNATGHVCWRNKHQKPLYRYISTMYLCYGILQYAVRQNFVSLFV